MGSQAIQGKLWGQRTEDWANIQEETGLAGYSFAIEHLPALKGLKLLDIGCGTGYFGKMVVGHGALLTGLDATPSFIEAARVRVPEGEFQTGEMEELPFANQAFEIVTGFNSFQYAADVKNALTEARRVLADGGKLVAMIWGNKEDCEAATYLKAVGSLLPAPPPGAPGPFALTENARLEALLKEVGFQNIQATDIPTVWDYPDVETALKGLLSVGPAARAIEYSGFEKVRETIQEAVKPYVQASGHVVYHNKFRVVIASK